MSTIGNKGKFSERIKKIARDRRKANKANKNELKYKLYSISKIVVSPIFILISGFNKSKEKEIINEDKKRLISTIKQRNSKTESVKFSIDSLHKDVNKINQDIFSSKQNIKNNLEDKIITNQEINNYGYRKISSNDKLKKEIINIIRKRLVSYYNEYELISTDLFLLSELGDDNIYLVDCKEKIKEVKKLLSKVKSIKEKYNLIKDNYDFEYMYELNDLSLYDKIIEFKNNVSYEDMTRLAEDYKLLKEFEKMYFKLEVLENKVHEFKNHREEKMTELRNRDIDFDKFKDKVYNYTSKEEEYNRFISHQNDLLRELDSKVNKIDSYETVEYRIKGFGKLVTNSFKYLGLLLASPLKGLIPSIATQTIITGNIIRNLRDNMEINKSNKIIYFTNDFSDLINRAIGDLEFTESMIDKSLDDIIKLKKQYINEYQSYEKDFVQYKDTIKKLNKIENSIINNKIRIGIIQENMKTKKKQNESTKIKVKELNNSQDIHTN